MKKIISVLFILVISLFFILNLSGCIGYYSCTERSIENPEYMTDYVSEYNFEDYEIYSAWFGYIQSIGEFLGDEDINVTPDQNHKMIVSHKEHLLRLLYVTECTGDDIYYYEVMFPTFVEAYEIFREYVSENNLDIELITLEDIENIEFNRLLYYVIFDDYEQISPIAYRLTMYVHEDEEGNLTDRSIYIIATGEDSYAIIEYYRISGEEPMQYIDFTTTLLEFTLNDLPEEVLEE